MALMAVETLVVGQLNTNCYLFYDQKTRKTFIIDPGDDGGFIINKIKDLDLKPQAILATHGHFDHLLAATELKLAYQIPFYLDQADLSILKRTQPTARFFIGLDVDPPVKVDHFLKEKEKLKINNLSLEVFKTPGHTPGGVSFYSKKENLIFVGDLLFASGSHGRTDLQGGDLHQLQQSIKKILSLSIKTIIYPGHGQATTIKKEREFYQDLLK